MTALTTIRRRIDIGFHHWLVFRIHRVFAIAGSLRDKAEARLVAEYDAMELGVVDGDITDNHPGCCQACNGTGTSGDPETNGDCWDCRGTGHPHEADHG